MAYSDSNFFDKLCDSFGNCMTMEEIAKFALTSKVILSYKIDFLNSFQLMKGLWKRSSNGYIYPLDNQYEKILYVEINEDYEADLEESLKKLRDLSVAHKVLAERSASVLSSNQNTVCVDVSEPQINCHDTESDQEIDAQKVLDELPLPTFIKEMAEAAKRAELDAIQEPVVVVQRLQDDHFTQRHQLFAKLATLKGSHFKDLVTICVNNMRFSTILGSLFNGCQHSAEMLHEVDKSYDRKINSDQKMNSDRPYFEGKVMSTIVSNAIPPIGLIKNVVLPLLWGDLDWFMGSNLSMVLGVDVFNTKCLEQDNSRPIHSSCFECPLLGLTFSGLNNLPYISSEHNYAATRLTNGKCISQLFDSIPFRSTYTANSVLNSPFTLDVDKGSTKFLISYPHRLVVANGPIKCALECDALSSWSLGCNLECLDYIDTFGMKGHYKVFDPGIGIMKASFFHNLTLEDKDDFRGEEDASKECTSELLNPQVLLSNVNGKNKSILLLPYVFDPGGLNCQCVMWAEHVPNSRICSVWRFTFHVGEIFVVATNHVSLQTREGISYLVGELVLGRLISQGARIGTLRLIWVFEPDSVGVNDTMLSTCKLFDENLKVVIKWLASVVVPFILKPSGLKYSPFQIESLLSEFLKATAATATTTYNLAQLKLLLKFHSSDEQSFAVST